MGVRHAKKKKKKKVKWCERGIERSSTSFSNGVMARVNESFT
jgi:hypothetical protein